MYDDEASATQDSKKAGQLNENAVVHKSSGLEISTRLIARDK